MLRSILRVLSLTLLASVATAQIQPQYFGVGSRYDLVGGAISRNAARTPTGGQVVAAGSSLRRIYVRFLADTDRDVTSFDLMMRSNSGPTVLRASLWSANAQDKPANELRSGCLGLLPQFEWHRAFFSDKFRVQGGQLYFMAFDLPANTQAELRLAGGTGSASVAFFTSATGSPQFAPLMYKVNTDGRMATIQTTTAFRGGTSPWHCDGLRPGVFGILVVGVSDTIGNSGLLPALASPPFVRGTVEWASLDIGLIFGLAGPDGRLSANLSYSPLAAQGLRFYGQCAAQAAPGSDQWVLSNAAAVTIN
jgi:hypothetical protein